MTAMDDVPHPPGADPLDPLVVFDRLVVGPVLLERERLVAPYRIESREGSDATDFVLRFGEPVFEPGEPASEGMATMVAAQIALNYGLFAREIVIHGPVDRADRRFIAEMTENTAREIYVNKLLAPNPFLRGAAVGIRPERRGTYSRARLTFPDARSGRATAWPGPPADRRHVAVLSSGGKDSLLTYGLLRELGYEVHPVFGNESGRHWFTALNAFRHFETAVANTTRVWMNADRVFNWMLRHFPFVRQDFATLRADIYPIRLWTVAVFLFAALPVVRRRGVGRVVIGNEHDTTRRARTHGIPHYDGLFDQSRFFDRALTRYYRQKGMDIAQFSILRPISELVVQQTLAARYPDLHRHQVSCHAAHADGDRMRPCGRCEKCRRIVGMLSAGGFDPGVCGYTGEQVAHALRSLETRDVHQSGPDAEHLAWLLQERGLIRVDGSSRRRARPHPEVECLRFDRERSPVDWMPLELRRPLVDLMAEHTRGVVERVGSAWQPLDPSSDRLDLPYAYEAAPPPSGRSSGG
jgi:7-cyano-7-deazaguanine synthase in queuosine biosynthesis